MRCNWWYLNETQMRWETQVGSDEQLRWVDENWTEIIWLNEIRRSDEMISWDQMSSDEQLRWANENLNEIIWLTEFSDRSYENHLISQKIIWVQMRSDEISWFFFVRGSRCNCSIKSIETQLKQKLHALYVCISIHLSSGLTVQTYNQSSVTTYITVNIHFSKWIN